MYVCDNITQQILSICKTQSCNTLDYNDRVLIFHVNTKQVFYEKFDLTMTICFGHFSQKVSYSCHATWRKIELLAVSDCRNCFHALIISTAPWSSTNQKPPQRLPRRRISNVLDQKASPWPPISEILHFWHFGGASYIQASTKK